MKNVQILGLVLALSMSMAGRNILAEDAKKTAAPADVVEVLKASGRYSVFVSLLDDAQLTEELRGKGPFTVFAPSDDAFKRFGNIDSLRQNRDALKEVLNNHIVEHAQIDSRELARLSSLAMRGGASWPVTSGGASINDAHIVQTDLYASNGVIYGIDLVLLRNADGGGRRSVGQKVGDGLDHAADKTVDTGHKIEHGVKDGVDKSVSGLKSGAEKIKDFFTGK